MKKRHIVELRLLKGATAHTPVANEAFIEPAVVEMEIQDIFVRQVKLPGDMSRGQSLFKLGLASLFNSSHARTVSLLTTASSSQRLSRRIIRSRLLAMHGGGSPNRLAENHHRIARQIF
jgi:hypothetical protein